MEPDWREILSFSQKELGQTDKEKLCESLSWMEADDIELNFTDLKTLFRLAQDILKHKTEQVNNLMGKLETVNRKTTKGNSKATHGSSTDMQETITNQEELIKANKKRLKELKAEITLLEDRKSELEGKQSGPEGKKSELEGINVERESDSSRDVFSEMDAVVRMENEIDMKNRHIRKLLSDLHVLEDENTKLKEKVSILKDKLLEATQLIDNLTEQILGLNNECSQLKEILGKTEQEKVRLSCDIESLRKEVFIKASGKDNLYEDIKSKVQHWKNVARNKKAELDDVTSENEKLKRNLAQVSEITTSPKLTSSQPEAEQIKITELQEKLIEASNKIEESANLISILKAENRQLKTTIEDTPDHTMESRNESDDGKQRILINKLRKKIKSLSVTLEGTEEMVAIRERELAEISSELQLLQSDEGVSTLIKGLRHKKNELKVKDEGIKALVREINNLNQMLDEVQFENETLRQKYNIPANEIISTTGTVKKYREMEQNNAELCKEIRNMENKLVNVELQNRNFNKRLVKFTKLLSSLGYGKKKIEEIEDFGDEMPFDGGGEASTIIERQETGYKEEFPDKSDNNHESEMKQLAEENEGLRRGLQEILNFLKDNSTTSSGVLALQCPSLEALLRSMEARHAAGWFAPHMATVMELRDAMGGKDALLTALHEARKETFDIMSQLSKEATKNSELERKVKELESINSKKTQNDDINVAKSSEFGAWVSDIDYNIININNKREIEDVIHKGNEIYEEQLKMSLEHFHNKFKALYDKITSMSIQAADESNKWSILEEQYKAQIEKLKSQIQIDDEDISENSPGLVSLPNEVDLQRKCSYLEDSYKYIRTLNENVKNENMDLRIQMMAASAEYEAEIQRLILAVINLTDKLRSSISIELFWKQNSVHSETVSKYRKLLEANFQCDRESDLFERLDKEKMDIISDFQKSIATSQEGSPKTTLSNIEESIMKTQIEELCKEIDSKSKKIEYLESRNSDLQEIQSTIINNSLASITQEEEDLLKIQLKTLTDENRILKEQCKHIGSQLDIALLQLQEHQQRKMSNDMESNLLRHQILDLQSNSDSKAIVARLSGEVLVAHLQATESNNKIEQLNSALNKEKELRVEAEEMFKARQKIFEVYSFRYESKFRYMFEVMQVLRQQYQGSLPLASIENYINAREDITRETRALNDKLQDLENLRSNLMAKHSIFDQLLDVSKHKCVVDQDTCSHKLNSIVTEFVHTRELEHVKKKLETLEQSREDLIKHCNDLEKTLVLVNQGFEKPLNFMEGRKHSIGEVNLSLELEDVGDDSSEHKSQTITLPKPKVLKQLKPKDEVKDNNKNEPKEEIRDVIGSPIKTQTATRTNFSDVLIQTISIELQTKDAVTQTIDDKEVITIKSKLESLSKELERNAKELKEALTLVQQRSKENLDLNTEKLNLESNLHGLKITCDQKDKIMHELQNDVDTLRNELDALRNAQIKEINKKRDLANADTKSLLTTLKQFENDKNVIAAEYKELLNNEREEYSKTIKELNIKLMESQSQLDRKGSDSNGNSADALKEIVTKYTTKIVELEDKAFKLQSDLDECKSEVSTYQSEVDRWRHLATDRLHKMEQLGAQLEERHSNEVESYKAESQHWLGTLADAQREHSELRARLAQQKAEHSAQLAERDAQIDHMNTVIANLKAQIVNLHSMLSAQDPSFDLSAIVVDGSDRHSDTLQIKFDSSDVNVADDGRATTSTAIWQEPIIERLRRDKQLTSKQNSLLRRQVAALAARERRARLAAMNLKNQVFRISSSGSRVATAESAALHTKVATLQAQLTAARRDTSSSIALWDKWKRAQQSADRWQARYEDKCQEVNKLEASIQLTKSALARLDREKRVLMSRINDMKAESHLSIEKQEHEIPEKDKRTSELSIDEIPSKQALLERVQSQQRRIVALELAEKGNEHLVSEYEKSLAEITSLKGQVLKLESTLLEAQIRTPQPTTDPAPELEYWKSYCEMLKEENVSLTHRVAALEAAPTSAAQHRVNDLEQTVLTLRGLVSKLQAEQKSSHKRVDSRPSSGRSSIDKGTTKLESHRIEVANLKRSIQDKDLLLERSKEMLKIAAEREDELLRENAFLRRQLNELTKSKEGFLSA